MLLYALFLVPLAGTLAAWVFPSSEKRPLLLPLFGLAHAVLVVAACASPQAPVLGGWLALDAPGKIVLGSVSLLFLVCAAYSVGYLGYYEGERDNRVFCAGLMAALATMTLVTLSHHFGLLWVAIDATTLSMAPLIYFNRNARSIEATWKYMLVCSVGIALALLGVFFLAYSSLAGGIEPTLLLSELVRSARSLSPPWLDAAFLFLLVGFGVKMGLAPLHTWKPDAYGEARLVGALLAGGMVSCAFLGVLRVWQVGAASGDAAFYRQALIGMGLFSMGVAAVFVANQSDFKRMLAYSSVEHVGILAIGVGLGGAALFGALFHILNNGLTKGLLFLSAGNLHRIYGSKSGEVVAGALRRAPWSGALFLAGFLAITGSPPFSPFISEFAIASGAFGSGRYAVGGLYLVLLGVVFLGMASTVLPILLGKIPPNAPITDYRDRALTVVPPLVLLAAILLLGVWMPEPLRAVLAEAAALLEGPR